MIRTDGADGVITLPSDKSRKRILDLWDSRMGAWYGQAISIHGEVKRASERGVDVAVALRRSCDVKKMPIPVVARMCTMIRDGKLTRPTRDAFPARPLAEDGNHVELKGPDGLWAAAFPSEELVVRWAVPVAQKALQLVDTDPFVRDMFDMMRKWSWPRGTGGVIWGRVIGPDGVECDKFVQQVFPPPARRR